MCHSNGSYVHSLSGTVYIKTCFRTIKLGDDTVKEKTNVMGMDLERQIQIRTL